VLALFITLGCGQTGPLFLPPSEPGATNSGAPRAEADPQPAAEEADTDKPE
jgi:predicted small lipoprotein YifL